MRVKAKCISKNGVENRVMGYYGHRRIREGQVFDLVPYTGQDGKIVSAEKQFSKKWMEPAEKSSAAVPARTLTPSPAEGESEPQKQISSEQKPTENLEPKPGPGDTATGDADVI